MENASMKHVCNTRNSLRFFMICLKNIDCNVDWTSETARCENCGTLLSPPKLLLAYYYFGLGWQGVVAAVVGMAIARKCGLLFVGTILVGVLSLFIFMSLIPALLAATGTWTSFSRAGYTSIELVDLQRKLISLRRDSTTYKVLLRLILLAMAILVAYIHSITV